MLWYERARYGGGDIVIAGGTTSRVLIHVVGGARTWNNHEELSSDRKTRACAGGQAIVIKIEYNPSNTHIYYYAEVTTTTTTVLVSWESGVGALCSTKQQY
jgi:hypothetical protein